MKKQLLSGLVAAAVLGTMALPVSAQNLAIVNGKAVPKERAEVLQELVAQPFTLRRAFHQAGDIDEFQRRRADA